METLEDAWVLDIALGLITCYDVSAKWSEAERPEGEGEATKGSEEKNTCSFEGRFESD